MAAVRRRPAAASLAGRALPAPPPALPLHGHISTAAYMNIREWLGTIRGHNLFHNIAHEAPTLQEGGILSRCMQTRSWQDEEGPGVLVRHQPLLV